MTPFEPDPDTEYDRAREDALREAAYIEAEREAVEHDEFGFEVPAKPLSPEELEDVPF